MSSEEDPLLPRNKGAPEIHYGSVAEDDGPGQQEQELGKQDSQSSDRRKLPLRTFFALFTLVVGFALIALVLPNVIHIPSWNDTPTNATNSLAARVTKILSENPLIDGHNDLAILIRYAYGNKIYAKEFTEPFENGGLKGHVDLPRLKQGQAGGAFWSAYVGCPKNGTDFSDANYAQAVAETLSQLDLLHRLIASYPTRFTPSTANSSSASTAFIRDQKLVSPIGIEGLHQIGNSYSNLRLYESLGTRYATLTHNCHNLYADAALITDHSGKTIAAPPHWGGVSKNGQELIREMNRIGMLVDLSHVSKNTMLDVLGGRPDKWKGSSAPVMFSHSSAYALCPHPRNVPDDVLQLVKTTNSIVMVNFAPDFISCTASNKSSGLPDFYPPNSTLLQAARHITYIGDRIGYDHVGIGSDFDGILDTPKGLDDVSKYPALVAKLLEFGVSDEDAAKVVGRNVLRVWSDAEKTAAKMQAAGTLPAEDEVSSPWTDDMNLHPGV